MSDKVPTFISLVNTKKAQKQKKKPKDKFKMITLIQQTEQSLN